MNTAQLQIARLRFWLSNLKVAEIRWRSIPERNIARELGYWRKGAKTRSRSEASCGTIACFGGWVALMPEFNAIGITPSPTGAPTYLRYYVSPAALDKNWQGPFERLGLASQTQEVEQLLFGADCMFDSRDDAFDSGLYTPRGRRVSDHAVVLGRIAARREAILRELKALR